MKDFPLLAAIRTDRFEIIPAELAQAIRLAAEQLLRGDSTIKENGVTLDYETILVLASRFASDSQTLARAETVRAENAKWKFLYRR